MRPQAGKEDEIMFDWLKSLFSGKSQHETLEVELVSDNAGGYTVTVSPLSINVEGRRIRWIQKSGSTPAFKFFDLRELPMWDFPRQSINNARTRLSCRNEDNEGPFEYVIAVEANNTIYDAPTPSGNPAGDKPVIRNR
jgi:hypothetical protein